MPGGSHEFRNLHCAYGNRTLVAFGPGDRLLCGDHVADLDRVLLQQLIDSVEQARVRLLSAKIRFEPVRALFQGECNALTLDDLRVTLAR